MDWYLQALKKYTVFTGRARRKEYWFFVLFNILISAALGIVDYFTGTYSAAYGTGLLGALYALGVILPAIAVTVRRLHDTGRSGWWFWIVLVPVVGGIVLLVFMLLEGQPGDNAYGPSPKAIPPGGGAAPTAAA
jgi:uncharacterized membrane protein YhaH (DUF805 family)